MKKFTCLICASILFLTNSCINNIATNENTITNINNDFNIKDKIINGRVDYSSFKIKNNTAISIGATVSVIYPSNYSDTNLRNTTMCTGLTDLNGNFSIALPNGFTPQVNDTYILESSRRINGPGTANISLRTYLRWNGTKWESITKNKILISKPTTAIASISDLNSSIITISDSINTIEYNQENIPAITYKSNLTETIYNRVLESVINIINVSFDPIEIIKTITNEGYALSNEGYIFNEVEQQIINTKTIKTALETYSVDWGGAYPNSVEVLKSEAISKNYWIGYMINPYAKPGTITQNIPHTINMSDYQSAKQTLKYKTVNLNSISDLKGVVLYEPVVKNNLIIKYFIYTVDTLGQFLKVNGSEYVLTNQ